MLTLPDEYDFFQVILTRTSYKKYGFCCRCRSHDQHPVQSLYSRSFV